MNRTKSQLLAKAYDVGLLNTDNSWTKNELIEAISLKYHLQHKLNRLEQFPAMLAKNARHMTEKELIELCCSGEYDMDPKIDGVRLRWHFGTNSTRCDSRNQSLETFAYCEYTDHFPYIRDDVVLREILGDTVLDCEAVWFRSAATSLGAQLLDTAGLFQMKATKAVQKQRDSVFCTFHVFDVLKYHGEDLRNLPDHERQHYLQRIRQNVLASLPNNCRFKFINRTNACCTSYSQFLDNYKQVIHDGFEGLMLKQRNGLYLQRHGSRTKVMYKFKKWDTLDAFVCGYTPGTGEFEGLVGAVKVGVFDDFGEIIEIGACNNMSYACRCDLTDENGSLTSSTYYQVVEVEFQEWTPYKRLRHPKLAVQTPINAKLVTRVDKSADDCTMKGIS